MNTDRRIIVVLYIVGIVLIMASETYFTAPMKKPGEINEQLVGERIKTEITVESSSVNDEITRVSSRERPELTFIAFEPYHELSVNQSLRLHGEVDLYHGNLQLVIDEVEQIS